MRSRCLTTSSMALVVLMGVPWTAQTQKAPQPAASSEGRHPAITKQQVDKWMKELSNWGRWGRDDQLGTMNLVTEAKRKQAVALAKTGTVVSLAHKPPLVPKAQAQSAGAFLQIHLNLLQQHSPPRSSSSRSTGRASRTSTRSVMETMRARSTTDILSRNL